MGSSALLLWLVPAVAIGASASAPVHPRQPFVYNHTMLGIENYLAFVLHNNPRLAVHQLKGAIHNTGTKAAQLHWWAAHEALWSQRGSREPGYLLRGDVVVLLSPFADRYFHFVTDLLPRLVLVRPLLLSNPSMRLLAPCRVDPGRHESEHSTVVMDVYRWLAIDPARVVCTAQPSAASSSRTAVERAILPTVPRTGEVHREALERVRRTFAEPFARRDAIVFASRRGAWARSLPNERKIVAAIRRHFSSFDVVEFTPQVFRNLSAVVDVFKRARVVVGPHGGALANIVFSPPGTAVIEIQHTHEPFMCFWHMATALGHTYHAIVDRAGAWDRRFRAVDPAVVVSTIHEALSGVHGTSNVHHHSNSRLSLSSLAPQLHGAGAQNCTQSCPASTQDALTPVWDGLPPAITSVAALQAVAGDCASGISFLLPPHASSTFQRADPVVVRGSVHDLATDKERYWTTQPSTGCPHKRAIFDRHNVFLGSTVFEFVVAVDAATVVFDGVVMDKEGRPIVLDECAVVPRLTQGDLVELLDT